MIKGWLTLKNVFLSVIGVVGLLIFGSNWMEVRDGVMDQVMTQWNVTFHGTPQWVQEPTVCKANSSVTNISDFSKLPGHIQEFLRYRHCKYFPTLLDVPDKCGGARGSRKVFLFLVIKSSPENYERRAVIRKTWGREAKYQGAEVRRLFISGIHSDPHQSRRMNRLLKLESREHNDILQWNFYDTFYNLTLKQFLFHQWLEINCPGARFVFNGDDDVFVNTFNIVTYLLGMKGSNDGDKHLCVGELLVNTNPSRSSGSRYYVPVQIMSSNLYPPYCSGAGILMSGFTARTIHKQSLVVEFIPIDDAYIGMCLENAGLKPGSHLGMRILGVQIPSNAQDPFSPCYYRELLMVHRFMPYEILIMWTEVQDSSIVCGNQAQVHLSG